jgi:[acyl-carrier-protein] S-malonyltransferase
MKAFLFPGQASQYVGMAKDLYEKHASIREIYNTANQLLDFDLIDVSFNGPLEKLTKTDITQPAVFVHSFCVYSLVTEKGFKPDVVAGHSLGEFNALVAAGVLKFEDALKIVAKRGQLMNECNQKNPGTMAAVLKFDINKIREACSEVNDIVQVANFNSDGQIVISGTVSGVHAAMEKIKEKGARIVKELQVGGAFHSPLMKPAEDELAKIINATTYADAHCDVYTNVTGQAERSGSKLQTLSVQQLTSSVLWFDIIQNMLASNVTNFIELGPGNVLTGIMKRLKGEFTASNIDTDEQVQTI